MHWALKSGVWVCDHRNAGPIMPFLVGYFPVASIILDHSYAVSALVIRHDEKDSWSLIRHSISLTVSEYYRPAMFNVVNPGGNCSGQPSGSPEFYMG